MSRAVITPLPLPQPMFKKINNYGIGMNSGNLWKTFILWFSI
jgi:hypothetical protein